MFSDKKKRITEIQSRVHFCPSTGVPPSSTPTLFYDRTPISSYLSLPRFHSAKEERVTLPQSSLPS